MYNGTTGLALYRITDIEVLTDRSSAALPDVLEKHEDFFGYMEDTPFAVSIKFAESVALYVAEREWSKDQQISDHEDGSITLDLTARSRMELCSWILSFGKSAELLSPEGLRAEIADIVKHLRDTYL